jgi:hypothetical protein
MIKMLLIIVFHSSNSSIQPALVAPAALQVHFFIEEIGRLKGTKAFK